MKTKLHKSAIKEISRLFAVVTLVISFLAAVPLSANAMVVPLPVSPWIQTTQTDFSSGTLNNVEITSSPGDIKLGNTGVGSFYALRGDNNVDFWKYGIAGNSWTAAQSTSGNVKWGGALAWDGGDYIYAFRGNDLNNFDRYSISTDTWTGMPVAPGTVKEGGALTYNNGYVYAMRGNNTRDFWRFNIAGNVWETRHNTVDLIYQGGALTDDNANYVYAFQCLDNNAFYRYNISADTWILMAPVPEAVGFGASLTWDGGNYIYALRGGSTRKFWRYDISLNSWAIMADVPTYIFPDSFCTVDWGGSLVYNGGYVYALLGHNSQYFLRYQGSNNTWSAMAKVAGTVSFGGALTNGPAPYYSSGTFISSTYDTVNAVDFQTISWNAATPAGTTLKFQVAANNSGSTWDFKGPDGTAGTYYTLPGAALWSGIDGYRYIKYKVFFSTTDTSRTPVLNDITISYVITPTAATNPAASVEEATATLNGVVANDGGAICSYAFEWGTASGVYTANTTWTGSVSNGNAFSAAVSGLTQGTTYYFRAKLKNSAGVGNDGVLAFLTKPEAPAALSGTVVSGTRIDLSWMKGTGANRTKVMRQTGSYPADYSTGTQVYFGTGTSISDTGLTSGITYYYRAWSEVTSGSLTRWSDGYNSTTCATIAGAAVITNAASAVEETAVTLNGLLANDGGQSCQYAFEWGTASGAYTSNTTWIGSLTTGQSFNVDLTGLANGQTYYYRALVKNSTGTAAGAEMSFLTKPEAPAAFAAWVVGGTQVDLSWTKGAGAVNTIVMRQTVNTVPDYHTGTPVYFGAGTSFTDNGLTPGTHYYYWAWSEVTAGSLQQWSDNYRSSDIGTEPTPAAVTNEPALVEETSVTFYGSVIYDIGEACQYRFVYGTTPGGPYPYDTGWTGSVTTGQIFSADVTGLTQGTKYYYVAQVKNSFGVNSDAEVHFLTKPEKPENPVVTVDRTNADSVTLTWTKGTGAQNTLIRRSIGSYPVDRFDGVEVYFGTGTTWVDTGLDPDTVYYYRLWSQVYGSEQWSDGWQEITVQTSLLTPPPPPTTTPPPTTPPPTTVPVTVGGTVFGVNKMQILAPWLLGLAAILAAAAGISVRVVKVKNKK